MNRRTLIKSALAIVAGVALPISAQEVDSLMIKRINGVTCMYTWASFLKDSPSDPVYWRSWDSAAIAKYGSLEKSRDATRGFTCMNYSKPNKEGWIQVNLLK